MNFDIKLTPESQKKVDALARAGKIDLRPTLNVVGKGYRKEVEMIFAHQQPRGAGDRWPQLSPEYAEAKKKRWGDQPILVASGSLLASMIAEGAPGNISIISKNGAVFGTSISYGIYHDSDEPRKGNLPRRNFSEPSDKRREIWIEQIRRDIQHNFEVNGIVVDGEVIQ
jgi:phage gpG-like protein